MGVLNHRGSGFSGWRGSRFDGNQFVLGTAYQEANLRRKTTILVVGARSRLRLFIAPWKAELVSV